MMDLHDTDGSGKIDFIEFLKMANSGKVRRNSHDEEHLKEVAQLNLVDCWFEATNVWCAGV